MESSNFDETPHDSSRQEERGGQRRRKLSRIVALVVVLLVVAVAVSVAVTLPSSKEKKKETSESSLVSHDSSQNEEDESSPITSSPEASPVPVSIPELSKSLLPVSSTLRSSPFTMILSPYLDSELLNETDFETWQEVTRQHLLLLENMDEEEDESLSFLDCSVLEIVPLQQSFVELPASTNIRNVLRRTRRLNASDPQQPSLMIEFQIDWDCWNMTTANNNSTSWNNDNKNTNIADEDTLLAVLLLEEELSLAWQNNNDTTVDQYIAMLQEASTAFEDIQEITVELLVDDEEEAEPPAVDNTTSSETSASPTSAPTSKTTASPTSAPTSKTTASPTSAPTSKTTASPTSTPTSKTTASPTSAPTPTPDLPAATVGGSYELLDTVPHDSGAFTQGFELVPGNPLEYFESTGLYGQSTVRRVDLATGQVLQRHDLDSSYFGEGLTYYLDEDENERLIQLTWKAGVVFRYDANTLQVIAEQSMGSSTTNGEGWGICHAASDNVFYVTDGTQYLHKWNVSTLELIDKVPVTFRDDSDALPQERSRLNELEWDRHSGTVLSNVWFQNYIVRINPDTGFITKRYDLSSLVFSNPSGNVLNGIAITDVPNEIWVTGKQWPNLYLIRLID